MGHNVHGLYDSVHGTTLETFRQRKGKGTSLIDYVFVDRVLLPRVRSFQSVFHHPSNHAMLTVSLTIDSSTENRTTRPS
jgi:hypothetical protein